MTPEIELKRDIKNRYKTEQIPLRKVLLQIFARHIGRENAVTQDHIEKVLHGCWFPLTNGSVLAINMRHVRAEIGELRKAGVPICGESGVGYYLPATWSEVVESTRTERAKAVSLLLTCRAIRKAARKYFHGQYDLF